MIDKLKTSIKKGIANFYSERDFNARFGYYHNTASRYLAKYPQQPLTPQEKAEIDDYWKQFGLKFPDYTWHEMYYGVTGIHDPRFIPDTLSIFVLCYHYVDRDFIDGWADKNLFNKLLPDINQPETFCRRFKGIFYDADWQPFDLSHASPIASRIIERMDGDDGFVLKYTRRSSTGKGVKVKKVATTDDIISVLKEEKSENYIIQKKIRQHPFLAQFNKSSVNILRVISWKHAGEVEILSVSVRYGIEGSFTDIVFVNGEEIMHVAGVDRDGQLNGRFATFRGLTSQPANVVDRCIPCYNAVVEFVKKAHLQLQPFDYIGWDITIDEKCQPVCIEYNLRWPGSVLYQYANGPLAGDKTERLLSFLKDEQLRKKYLHGNYLLK